MCHNFAFKEQTCLRSYLQYLLIPILFKTHRCSYCFYLKICGEKYSPKPLGNLCSCALKTDVLSTSKARVFLCCFPHNSASNKDIGNFEKNKKEEEGHVCLETHFNQKLWLT